jgi:hypothetical protein
MILTKACKEWPCSIRDCKKWPCQAVFRAWHLERRSTRAFKEWRFLAVLRAWHLDTHSTRACKECLCQWVFKLWHLANVSTRACKESPCQAVFRDWHLPISSTRACKSIFWRLTRCDQVFMMMSEKAQYFWCLFVIYWLLHKVVPSPHGFPVYRSTLPVDCQCEIIPIGSCHYNACFVLRFVQNLMIILEF